MSVLSFRMSSGLQNVVSAEVIVGEERLNEEENPSSMTGNYISFDV